MIYIVYVVVVFVGRLVYQRFLKKKLGGRDIPSGCDNVKIKVFISCTVFPGVATSPEGKELGENEEQTSANVDCASSSNMDSDYGSFSNAPIVSPGRHLLMV